MSESYSEDIELKEERIYHLNEIKNRRWGTVKTKIIWKNKKVPDGKRRLTELSWFFSLIWFHAFSSGSIQYSLLFNLALFFLVFLPQSTYS